MSGRVMKGFLVFTVVFFFAVVGLVGLTVVMKRHENAQIAKDDKTLVAPDPQKIQRLVEGMEYYDEIPDKDKPIIRQSVTALLKACPRIVNLLTRQDESLALGNTAGLPEWNGVDARYEVFVSFNQNNMQNIPLNLRSSKGIAGFGIGGGDTPGAYILWPFSRWLCNVPSKMTYHEMNEALDNKEATYKDLMHFIPLKDIPPNSF